MWFPKLSIVCLIYLASVALCPGIQFRWPLCGAGNGSWCRDPAANGYSVGRKIIHNHWITAAVIHGYRLAHDGNQKGALWLRMFCKASVLMGEGCVFLYPAVSQLMVLNRADLRKLLLLMCSVWCTVLYSSTPLSFSVTFHGPPPTKIKRELSPSKELSPCSEDSSPMLYGEKCLYNYR